MGWNYLLKISLDLNFMPLPTSSDPLLLSWFHYTEAAGESRRVSLGKKPCGGGGLTAGIATAVKAQAPEVAIYTVEPAGFDDTARSLRSGVREAVAADARSICDALQAPLPGAMTFPINKALVTGGLVVTDRQVRDAMRFAFSTLKLVVEPGGAVALAAMMQGLAPPTDGVSVVVLSGSNVDPVDYAAILTGTD